MVLSKRPTHVGYLIHAFDTGGIERCVVNLVNNINQEQCTPFIICLTKSGSSAQALKRDVPILEVEKRPGWDRAAIGKLAKLLTQYEIDVLHSHNWGTLIEGTMARRKARVPAHVHTEHGQGLHDDLRGPKRWLRRAANAWAFKRLNALATCARCVAPLVEARSGYPAAKMVYLPNGVPQPFAEQSAIDAAQQWRQVNGIPNDAIVVGSTGRLVAVKGFELAIEAVAELVTREREFHLVLVGDGEFRESLAQHAAALHVGARVHFAGHQTHVGPWLELFDVFVNTSRSEAMSLSVLEAMAVGLPVVAADVGDNRDILLGYRECGKILECRDAIQLAKRIEWIAEHPIEAKALGRNARLVFEEHFSMQSMVDRHQALYREFIPNQQTRTPPTSAR